MDRSFSTIPVIELIGYMDISPLANYEKSILAKSDFQ